MLSRKVDECKPLPTGVDMLAACLAPEPSARPTAGELLSMAYFHGVPESFSDAFHGEVEAGAYTGPLFSST